MDNDGITRIDLGDMPAMQSLGNGGGKKRRANTPAAPARPAPHKDGGWGALPVQLLVCGAVCVAVIGMRSLDLPVANQALSGIKIAVTGQDEYDRLLGRLTFISNIFDGSSEVMSTSAESLVSPLQGEVVGVANGAVQIKAAGAQAVRAAAAGRVFYSGPDKIRLVHPSGYETVYVGVTPAVKAGDELEAGAAIGQVEQDQIVEFTLLLNGQPVAVETLLQ